MIQRLIESRTADDQTAEFLADALTAWMSPGADPSLAVHLVGAGFSREQLKREMRNAWLCDAARVLEVPPTRSRARALLAEITTFERRKWPIWRTANFPPAHATALEARLFYAMRAGAEMPTTSRQIHKILQS
ncbi:hypothetical protein ACKVEX_05480 [Rhodocyclaceae bacterium SMB388]